MLFDFDHLICYISQFMTLKIGDLIFTGTPAGVGPLKIGDQLTGYIEDKKMLIEAKSSCSRTTIRSGIGQLLDYRFQLQEQEFKVKEICLLLPTKPRENIMNLLSNLGIKLIFKKGKDFISN